MTNRSAHLQAAVEDNIRWCAAVHATDPNIDGAGMWTTPDPPHPLFPDLVTARPHVADQLVADRLATRSTATVKDSFADLNLEPHGFTVLFDAQWIALPTCTPHDDATPGWSVVDSIATLTAWSAAAGLPVNLPPHLLTEPDVTVLARSRVVGMDAGVAVTSHRDTAGISNVFGCSPDLIWADVAAVVSSRFPGRTIVGYERGPDLDAARTAGFDALGPLRVWSKAAHS